MKYAMEQAVFEELGGRPTPSRYYLAGLSDDVPDAIQTMPPPVNYTPPVQAVDLPFSPVLWNNPEPGNTPAFDASPIALTIATSNADDWLKSVSAAPAPNPYTYHTPPGQFVGPPAPPGWTPTPPPSQPPVWANILVKTLDTTVKAGGPAATTYFNYELAAQRANQQPIYLMQAAAQKNQKSSSDNYTLLIVGGVVAIGIIAALVVLATK